jgi:hypothetical protein
MAAHQRMNEEINNHPAIRPLPLELEERIRILKKFADELTPRTLFELSELPLDPDF